METQVIRMLGVRDFKEYDNTTNRPEWRLV